MSVEKAEGHTVWWLVEQEPGDDPEVTDWTFMHPKDCPHTIEASSDADGNIAWQGITYECAVQYLEDYLKEDYFEDLMKAGDVGEHEVKFKYTYRYYPPAYPDYEPDYDFEWEAE